MSENESILSFCLSFLSQGQQFIVSEVSEVSGSPPDFCGETVRGSSLMKTISETCKEASLEQDGSIKNQEASQNSEISSSKEKSFKCSFEGCKKSFEYRWILERHVNSHFCFKLFKCEFPDCSKAYKSKENLNLHHRNKHMNEKPYQCRFCISRFSHRNGKIYLN